MPGIPRMGRSMKDLVSDYADIFKVYDHESTTEQEKYRLLELMRDYPRTDREFIKIKNKHPYFIEFDKKYSKFLGQLDKARK